jgi:iron complex transport system substrate-binding protein
MSQLSSRNGWNELQAVQNKQVFIADGNQYFNRPGPRLVDSTQILAEIIHPSIFRDSNTYNSRWINLSTHQFHQQLRV